MIVTPGSLPLAPSRSLWAAMALLFVPTAADGSTRRLHLLFLPPEMLFLQLSA